MGLEDLPVLDLVQYRMPGETKFLKLPVIEVAEICSSVESRSMPVKQQNCIRYVAGITQIEGINYVIYGYDAYTTEDGEHITFQEDRVLVDHARRIEEICRYRVKKDKLMIFSPWKTLKKLLRNYLP